MKASEKCYNFLSGLASRNLTIARHGHTFAIQVNSYLGGRHTFMLDDDMANFQNYPGDVLEIYLDLVFLTAERNGSVSISPRGVFPGIVERCLLFQNEGPFLSAKV